MMVNQASLDRIRLTRYGAELSFPNLHYCYNFYAEDGYFELFRLRESRARERRIEGQFDRSGKFVPYRVEVATENWKDNWGHEAIIPTTKSLRDIKEEAATKMTQFREAAIEKQGELRAYLNEEGDLILEGAPIYDLITYDAETRRKAWRAEGRVYLEQMITRYPVDIKTDDLSPSEISRISRKLARPGRPCPEIRKWLSPWEHDAPLEKAIHSIKKEIETHD
jgi:hypothetical protein